MNFTIDEIASLILIVSHKNGETHDITVSTTFLNCTISVGSNINMNFTGCSVKPHISNPTHKGDLLACAHNSHCYTYTGPLHLGTSLGSSGYPRMQVEADES